MRANKGSGFSGKKKKQTIKAQVIVNREGETKSVSDTVAGNMHTDIIIDKKVKIIGDLAYIGTICETGIKKRKNKELSKEEKEYNKEFSRRIILAEHIISRLKKFRILDYKFRNPVKNHNLMFRNVAGLVIFNRV